MKGKPATLFSSKVIKLILLHLFVPVQPVCMPKATLFSIAPQDACRNGIEFVTPRSKALVVIGNGTENNNGALLVLYVHRAIAKSVTVVRAAAVRGDAFYSSCSINSCWGVCL